MFGILTERVHRMVERLRRQTQLKTQDIDDFIRQLRMALIDADCAPSVVQQVIKSMQGTLKQPQFLQKMSPSTEIIALLKEQLTGLLGSAKVSFSFQGSPAIWMLVGLQGAGKTTTAAKIAYQQQQQGVEVGLVSLDIYRPAAREQLAILAKEHGLRYLDIPLGDVVQMATAAREQAKNMGVNLLIVDTAGRLHLDLKLMQELCDVEKTLACQEILLVLDSMMGQDAAVTAKAFAEKLPLTGGILTKMDGDARGGAALSIGQYAKVPIKLIGTGEKVIDSLEIVVPERLAGRILGEGDVSSLLEKAVEKIGKPQVKALSNKAAKGQFNLQDLLEQLINLSQMGNLQQLLQHLPVALQQKINLPQDSSHEIKSKIAILRSMTKSERVDPNLLARSSRKRRIASGSGRTVAEVNQLLKHFEMMRKMGKKMGKQPSFQ